MGVGGAELNYGERLNKLTITDSRIRPLGIFYNWIDLLGMPGMLAIALVSPYYSSLGKTGSQSITLALGVACLAGQVYLALKGYTVSKMFLGRKVMSKNTLEKANPFIILLRPFMAYGWMMCMCMVAMMFAVGGAAVASMFHRKEVTEYDVAVNNAMTASMSAASMGIFSRLLFNYPKLVWLHDTVCQTLVVSVPYTQVKAELMPKTAEVTPLVKNKEVELGKKVEASHKDAA